MLARNEIKCFKMQHTLERSSYFYNALKSTLQTYRVIPCLYNAIFHVEKAPKRDAFSVVNL